MSKHYSLLLKPCHSKRYGQTGLHRACWAGVLAVEVPGPSSAKLLSLQLLRLLRIPQFATELLVVQRAQLYEAFTAARLIGFFDVREQVPELAARLESWRQLWSRVRASPLAERSVRDSEEKQSSPVPYDAILHVASITFVQGRATELYPLPFLLPQYNLVFEPLETTPVHYVSQPLHRWVPVVGEASGACVLQY